MLALALALVAHAAAAAPSPGPGAASEARPRALVLDLAGDAVGPETRKSLTGLVVVKLSRDPRIDVISGQELKRLANLEADKQAAGCDDSCLAEIAGAMDARLVVSGFVGRLGSLYVVNLSLFDAQKARAVGRANVEAEHIEDLASRLDPAVDAMLRDLPLPRGPATAHGPPYLAMGLTGGGAVALVVGAGLGLGAGLFYADAAGARGKLDDAAAHFGGDAGALSAAHDAYVEKRDAYNSTGVVLGWAAAVAVVAGAAAAGTGAALWAQE